MASEGEWYRDAVLYEVPVRAFRDSDGDGIGDFRGLTSRLGYLEELGVTALWILPFYPSPLRDDGYDIADYRDVHPDYGTLDDFRTFLGEAHRRGLRVVTELVMNHTSDRHAWFERARHAPPGSPEREFYVWSDTPDRYAEARIIFQDFEDSNWSWDPVAGAYYWHRFYSHQPDLNFDNPRVREEILGVMDFWFGMGVDGMRLDAVPYLFEREGTNCENLPETHAFLRDLRRHVDERFPGRMLLAEANQWPEDAVAYFGDGDECHMAFHFPLMPRLFMGIRMEDRFPIEDILEQTPRIPESAQWAVFLRNHDELTLEMVTDEERDYMYRVYASQRRARINLGIRRRLAPLLSNNRRKIELMYGLLLSLPGSPVLYYGDEIGMGDNIYLGDRNGVRTPMQWSGNRNAGFSDANPQRLYLPVISDPEYRYEAVNVESQEHNPSSLLWWVRRLVNLRRRHPAFGRGGLTTVDSGNPKVLAFSREYDGERLLVAANLSRFAQQAAIDLSAEEGRVPVESFGGSPFPRIDGRPYPLTLGPHAFYWFVLQSTDETTRVEPGPEDGGLRELLPPSAPAGARAPVVAAPTGEELLRGGGRPGLEIALPGFVEACRWFGGKGGRVRAVRIVESIPLDSGEGAALALVVAEVDTDEEEGERYLLPLQVSVGEEAGAVRSERPEAIVAEARVDGTDGVVLDALASPPACARLLDLIRTEGRRAGRRGVLEGLRLPAFAGLDGEGPPPEGRVLSTEQSNSSVRYDDRFLLKLFRHLEEGINPDLEVSRFLSEHGFRHAPPAAGALVYRRTEGEEATVAFLAGFVESRGDAWTYTLESLGRFFERVLADGRHEPEDAPYQARALLALADAEVPVREQEWIGAYLESARLLGRRTAELHAILASDPADPDFAPEPFSALYRRSLYQSARNLVGRTFRSLGHRAGSLPEEAGRQALRLRGKRDVLLERFRGLTERRIDATRIRCHGDYHLGQVLSTGKDFVILDFEGEPARPVGTRRIKRSALTDVAGMLRSLHYAGHAALRRADAAGLAGAGTRDRLLPWASFWTSRVGAAFLGAYLTSLGEAAFLPTDVADTAWLLDLHMLEKAVYELGYELSHRPDWVPIPVEGILDLLDAGETSASGTRKG
jgi:maltose alpha-D-glucosyltransferase/alpha-amylase